MISTQTYVTDGNSKTDGFLHLELDVAFSLVDFLFHTFTVSKKGWEFASLVETRTKETRNLSDDRFRGQEGVITLCQFFNEFLILVKTLQILNIFAINAQFGGFINVLLVSKNADLELGFDVIGEFDLTTETFVL